MATDSNSALLCNLCGYAVDPVPPPFSAETPQDDRFKATSTLYKFCRQIKVNCDSLIGLSLGPTTGGIIPACPECLRSLGAAAAAREKAEEIEVQVRCLQREVLKLLRNLEQCMASYLSEMRAIEDKVKGADVTCLKATVEGGSGSFGGHFSEMVVSDCFQFREGILNVVKDLSLFQSQLSVKVHKPQANNKLVVNSVSSLSHVKMETEDNYDVGPPDFCDNDLSNDELDEGLPSPSSDFLPSSPGSSESYTPTKTTPNRKSSAGKILKKCLERVSPKTPVRKRRAYSMKNRKRHQIRCRKTLPPLPTWAKSRNPLIKCRTFFCQLCPDFMAKSPSNLESHLREHELALKDDPKTFPCPHCTASFALKQLHELHVLFHSRCLAFYCDQCKKRQAPMDMLAHYKEAHGTQKIFQCDNCTFCFSIREAYLEHLRAMHTGTNVIMSCDLCPAKLYTRKDHLDHLHQQHGAIERIDCGIDGCTRSFLDTGLLKKHQILHTRPFTCFECDYKFTNRRELEDHQTIHSDLRPWKCTQCPLTFKRERFLKTHQEKHERDSKSLPDHKCHLCEKSFKLKKSLAAHLKFHQGRDLVHTCELCGAAFAFESQLKRHLQTHGERERKYFCEHCGKTYLQERQLTRHLQTVHENTGKNFQCPQCPKTFFDNHLLRQHLRIHTGEKPLSCNICGKAFNQGGSLWHHKKRAHPQESNPAADDPTLN